MDTPEPAHARPRRLGRVALGAGVAALVAIGSDQVGPASLAASLAMGWGLTSLVVRRRAIAGAAGALLGAWAAVAAIGFMQLQAPASGGGAGAAETRPR